MARDSWVENLRSLHFGLAILHCSATVKGNRCTTRTQQVLRIARIGSYWTAIFDRLRCEPQAMAALSGSSIDGKQAVRSVFNAAECVFKLMNPRSTKLTSAEAVRLLQATSQVIYASNPTAQRAANKMIHSFADWVDACHNYRHEEGVEEPSQPPLDLAIELIGVGSGFLWWLISADTQTQS